MWLADLSYICQLLIGIKFLVNVLPERSFIKPLTQLGIILHILEDFPVLLVRGKLSWYLIHPNF